MRSLFRDLGLQVHVNNFGSVALRQLCTIALQAGPGGVAICFHHLVPLVSVTTERPTPIVTRMQKARLAKSFVRMACRDHILHRAYDDYFLSRTSQICSRVQNSFCLPDRYKFQRSCGVRAYDDAKKYVRIA